MRGREDWGSGIFCSTKKRHTIFHVARGHCSGGARDFADQPLGGAAGNSHRVMGRDELRRNLLDIVGRACLPSLPPSANVFEVRPSGLGSAWQMVMPQHLLRLVAWSALFFGSCYAALAVTHAGRPRGGLTKAEDAPEWDSRVVSNLHAGVTVAGGIFCALDSLDYTREGTLFGYSHIVASVCSVFMGYLLYDSVLCIATPTLRSAGTLLHHVLFLVCCWLNLANSFMKFQFMWLILCEISTPFVNRRWFLAATGNKATKAYRRNAAGLCATFFGFRVVGYGVGLAHLASLYDLLSRTPGPLLLVPLLVFLAYGLNLIWMRALFRGYRNMSVEGSREEVKADLPKAA